MGVKLASLAWPKFPDVDLSAGAQRDTALDVVRSWSLLVVVFGHFIMQITYWDDGGIPQGGNTLASGSPWPFVTWILQVMPLFFIAGGAVNRGSYERFTGSYQSWLWQRVRRLLKPTLVFILVMSLVFSVVTILVPQRITDPLVPGITGPLWFLSVYILVTAFTPVSVLLWNNIGKGSILVLTFLVGFFDFLRLNIFEPLGILNLFIAWVLVHQLGFWYQEGVSRKSAWALVSVGFSTNLVLTQILNWYPTSLVGIANEEFSNMAPPTIVLVMHSLVLFGAFALLADRLRQWVSRKRPARATAIAGMLAMTIYLWHMSVLVLWLVLLHTFNLDLPVRLDGNLVVPDGYAYWLWLVPSTFGFAVLLYLLVRYLWPLEFMKIAWFDADRTTEENSKSKTILGSIALSVGILGVSGAGFSGFPLAVHTGFGIPLNAPIAILVLILGLLILRPSSERVGSGVK